MPDKQPRPLLGRLAVHNKLITMDQLEEALSLHGRPGEERRLGDILRDLGYLDQRMIDKLVEAQRRIVAQAMEKRKAGGGGEAAPSGPPAARPAPPAARPSRAAPAASESPRAAEPTAAARPAAPAPAAAGGPIDAVLRSAIASGASDVHVHAGHPVRLRRHGALVEADGPPIAAADAESMLLGALDADARSELESSGEVDLCYAMGDEARFRANVYRQQHGLDGVFRFIPPRPPTLAELGLPSSLAKLVTYHQGMVLVTGPAGCGKTATLAALVDLVNEERRSHVLTIEDPIEYVHASKRCLVNQRSVKRHTGSFARALRAALREDPDVIVIGELRDLETISLALSAAETGHLVLATLHTDNSLRTLNRVVGAFPADQQEQVRTMLSESLRAVLSQRLLPRADGDGRVVALETLVVTKAVANLIRENKVFQIHSILQTGAAHGMGLLEQSVRAHLQAGTIDRDAALRAGLDPRTLAA